MTRGAAEKMAAQVESFTRLLATRQGVDDAARPVTAALENGGPLHLCGNGGSAADAQHLAAELRGHFLLERAAF